MPRTRAQHQKADSIEEEAIIEEALAGIRSGKYPHAKAAAAALNAPKKHMAIWRRLTGRAKPRSEAHAVQQLLNVKQEEVLVEYILFLGHLSIPLNKRTVLPKVEALCGKKPAKGWIERFLGRHPRCKLARPSGLDPKRARAFNFTNVNMHFE